MNTKHEDDHEDKIRARAYQLWEDEGRPDGRHTEHWHRAADEAAKAGVQTNPQQDSAAPLSTPDAQQATATPRVRKPRATAQGSTAARPRAKTKL